MTRTQSLAKGLAALQTFTGLEAIHAEVKGLRAFAAVQKKRTKLGLPKPHFRLHMAFRGPPGTGKSEMAWVMAEILYGLGFLHIPSVHCVDRSMLVADHIGGTARATREQFDRAAGGVLFIDEAYTLVSNDRIEDWGREAVDTLMQLMETSARPTAVIFAGYTDGIDQLLASNPGLRSRVGRVLDFIPPSDAQLVGLLRNKFAAEDEYTVDPAVDALLLRALPAARARHGRSFGNARWVRELYRTALIAHARRLHPTVRKRTPPDPATLSTLTEADLREALRADGYAPPVGKSPRDTTPRETAKVLQWPGRG